MLGSDLKMAVASLRGVKWRSGLTILSIVIGVVSLTTILSLGNGVKHQFTTGANLAGKNLITIRPGNPFKLDSDGRISNVDLAYGWGFGAGGLSDSDLNVVKNTKDVALVSPVNYIAGSAKTEEREFVDGFIIGAEDTLQPLINQKMAYGSFLTANDQNSHFAIIGKTVAEKLFEDNVPIGRNLKIRGQDFSVKGVFDHFQPNTLALGADLNRAIFIPYLLSRKIPGADGQIVQILAKPSKPEQLNVVATNIKNNLVKNHFGQNDVSVIKQTEAVALSGKVLSTVMSFVGGVAAIALLASGIGIMNIMLLSVNERTREIGIRKAIGATNRQLLRLFWFEALVLGAAGAFFGIIGSFLAM